MAAQVSDLALLLDQLRRTLEEERGVLLSGTPEQVNAIASRKLGLADQIERATAALDGATPAHEVLGRLARYNRENAVICAAILRHMTAALDRLRQHDPHRSYRADGSEQNPPSQRPLGAA